MNMFRLITSLLLTILPIAVLIRDWKYHDRRTKRHHNITRVIIVIWCIGSVAATFFVWVDSAQIDELVSGKNTLITQNQELSAKVDAYQNDLNEKERKILELEREMRILRSIEGTIECLLSANWGKHNHPGDIIPISWNKAQFYVRIFEENANDDSPILFYLDNVKTTKVSESDLRVKLTLKADSSNDPFGQELYVLKRYGHLLVNIPFVNKGDTLDGKMTLKDLKATFVINGEHKSQIQHSDNFEITLPGGDKLPAVQLNKKDLFHNIFKGID